ncbi:pyrroloquinoline quinone biosynthesis protein PqqB [Tistrella mobilis]|uniref:pyrroloquinoline quinone biosynthesis protein PqqB n=1 Tax=Tistrella mobilis TaxID=171437 RepID=UPI0035570967
MRILVLGAAAGGGFPQWNCRCPVCALAWAGDPRVRPRTQSSLALSGDDGRSWVLLNASPDLRTQILATPALHPTEGARHSPIAEVVLANGDVDHTAGLLSLRERQPFRLHAAQATLDILAANRIFDVLAEGIVARQPLPLDRPVDLAGGLTMTAFPAPGKVPLYMESDTVDPAETVVEDGRVLGFVFEAGGRRAVCLPNCAAVTPAVLARVRGAEVLVFDGTTFTDDEMPQLGLSPKTAARMGHLAIDGPRGSLAGLADIRVGRRIYVHINNTNPILIEGGPERRLVEAAGWEVAHDGMEIVL